MANVMKNISTTAAVLSLAFATAGNSSLVVSTNYTLSGLGLFMDVSKICDNSSMAGYTDNNIYIDKSSRLKSMAEESFGVMRDATEDELKEVDQYIKSISKPTGVNFFSLC